MPEPQMIQVNADDLRMVLDDNRVGIGVDTLPAKRLRAALPEPTPPITVGCRVRGSDEEGTVRAIDGDDAWVRFWIEDAYYHVSWRLTDLTYVGPGDPPPAPIPAEAQAVIDAADGWERYIFDSLGEIGVTGPSHALRDAVRAYREVQDRGR